MKLELDLEIDFADNISKWDYNKQKENFINRNNLPLQPQLQRSQYLNPPQCLVVGHPSKVN